MRYLISGYYGEGNAGDEAILAGILQEVQREDPRAEFTVLSFNPEDTRLRHGVPSSSTGLRDPQRLVSLLLRSDLLISGGGSMLHEADFELHGRSFLLRAGKLRPIPYFLSMVMAARALNRPVMWYAQGLGPLHTPAARWAVRLAAGASQVVCWRDREAALLAVEVGARAGVQAVVPDPAYALTASAPETVDAVLQERVGAWLHRAGRAGFLAVCPRPWLNRRAYQNHLVAVVAEVCARTGLGALFLPFQERTDGPLCQALADTPAFAGRAVSLHQVDQPRLLLGLLGRARAAVTMRLHAGILSAAAGTPCVPLAYDPKIHSFATQTGQREFVVTVDELESEDGARRLRRSLECTLAREAARRVNLKREVAPLKRTAGATAHLAVQLAKGRLFDGR